MTGRCSGGTVGLVTWFLFIVVLASPALGRPQAPNVGAMLTNASTNAGAINSTALLSDGSKDCKLNFCKGGLCDDKPDRDPYPCYCCVPNVEIEVCYTTKNACRAHCGRVCKT
ncbi:hypothetical protein EJB05_46125 [Eragrostis curvula]|uniref:Bowman-Birk serine protease inhibitors family domain-containing protein n=1 Tax=Eragrostis curvula TaxID=38414 RepID=A0A5J9TME3_9POAL|nr:hypothetical protein EJB05_46125 [Eragrostis curvula]